MENIDKMDQILRHVIILVFSRESLWKFILKFFYYFSNDSLVYTDEESKKLLQKYN